MSNPTSNFGWQMPTATDLVTDLPADFEVFGQAVDTDFVDLLGGTTGQVLSKTSATDLDFTWINNDTGDITGVTAGTGISGGGTSGTVTVTNDMATTITAAGDIVVGTGSGTYDNLPIGTTAQVLTADTTVSPYKVKWATPAAGGGMTLLSTTTLTSTTTTVSSISQSYKNLYIEIENITQSAFNPQIIYKTNATATVLYSGQWPSSAGGPWYATDGTIGNGQNYGGGSNNYAAWYIYDYTNSSRAKVGTFNQHWVNEGGANIYVNGGMATNHTGAVSSIAMTLSTGTFTTGTIRIYGVL